MAEKLEIEKVAAELFATAWNKLDSSYLKHVLADKAIYLSRKTRKKIEGKQKIMDYLQNNMNKIKKAGKEYTVFAEMGTIFDNNNCVLLSQKNKENIHTLVLFTIEWDRVTQIDICANDPHPTEATRTGEYPGYEDFDDDFDHYFDDDIKEKTNYISISKAKKIIDKDKKITAKKAPLFILKIGIYITIAVKVFFVLRFVLQQF